MTTIIWRCRNEMQI